ncbi:hypothetical protein NPIL_246041 [Nephila pilipes]|uniref:Uncharacterized protein n=1 Tax=Nephila pilipes TaxID=299642 RepID=A0A8X6MDX0_NEPPI|nr:hypothetical protein NPIL_246041 [Nephila pilipes]
MEDLLWSGGHLLKWQHLPPALLGFCFKQVVGAPRLCRIGSKKSEKQSLSIDFSGLWGQTMQQCVFVGAGHVRWNHTLPSTLWRKIDKRLRGGRCCFHFLNGMGKLLCGGRCYLLNRRNQEKEHFPMSRKGRKLSWNIIKRLDYNFFGPVMALSQKALSFPTCPFSLCNSSAFHAKNDIKKFAVNEFFPKLRLALLTCGWMIVLINRFENIAQLQLTPSIRKIF